MFRRLLQGVSRRLPSRCAVCHTWPSQALCEACVGQFAQPCPRCARCALPLEGSALVCGACLQDPPELDACLSAVPYAYPWTGLVVDFKFGAQPGWARSFATLLRSTPWVEPALEAADWIVPMPLSPERLRLRGYNQALLLAKQLVPEKVHAAILLRVKDTPPQSGLARKERLLSVRGAFVVDPLHFDLVRGRRVVIVDDVMTSGASLESAAWALRQAGAAHITGLVLARTE